MSEMCVLHKDQLFNLRSRSTGSITKVEQAHKGEKQMLTRSTQKSVSHF